MNLPDHRLCHDWLVSYLELTKHLEAQESLHLWTGLTVLSAALRRNVYLDMDYGKIFPNLYVIIVAVSAKARKSVAMDHGRDLLIDALPYIRIHRDSGTSQGLIKQLNKPVQVIKDGQIKEELRSDVGIFADEVANLFSYDKTRASQMVIFLTRAYTCPSVYDHTTVRDSVVRLHNLYPVLLGGTDPRNLKVLPEDAVGGLTGRLIWVIESTRRMNNPGWKSSESRIDRELLYEYLVHDLIRISKLSGAFKVDQDAMDYYDTWYNELSKRDASDPETDAFYHRCHTTALRICQLLSVSQDDSLRINLRQMEASIKLIEMQLPEVKRVTLWSGVSQYEQHRAKCIHYLQSVGSTATQRVLLKHMGMLGEDFQKMIATLVSDGTIDQPVPLRGEIIIRLSKNGIEGGKQE